MTKISALDETNYIVGIDLSAHEAVASYLDHKTLKPTILDISGGYGQPAIPFVLQYIEDEHTWLIGEQAKMNEHQEGTVFIKQLFELMLLGESLRIDDQVYLPEALVCLYIHKILDSFTQLNPKAKVTDLVVALPDPLFEEIQERILECLKASGLLRVQIISTVHALVKFLQYEAIDFKEDVRIFHYEHQQFRVSRLERNTEGLEITIDQEEEALSVKAIEETIQEVFTRQYLEYTHKTQLTEEDANHLSRLSYTQMPWFFQKYIQKQSMKIYYNFAFPPFTGLMTYQQMEDVLSPYKEKFKGLLQGYQQEQSLAICIGAGFKMQWPQVLLNEKMSRIPLNPFESIAKGCCIMAAQEYIRLPQWLIRFKPCRYRHLGILTWEQDQEKFTPIKEGSNSFVLEKENTSDNDLVIYYKEPSTKALTIEQTIPLEAEWTDTWMRLNLQVTYLKESIQIALEYLPL